MNKLLGLLLALTLTGVSGCASSGGGSAPGEQASERRSANLITAEELAELEVDYTNVFDAVRRLRPSWLRVRGRGMLSADTESTIPVYVDGVLRGSTRLLGRMRPSAVLEIRHMSPSDAALRYGASHRDGAIWVTLR